MYKYKFLQEKQFYNIFKKVQLKALAPIVSAIVALVDIVAFLLLWNFVLKKINFSKDIYFSIIIAIILFQIISSIVYYNKITNKKLKEDKDLERILSFDDNGVKIYNKDIFIDITWDGIKDIKVYEDYLIINYNMAYEASNVFIFKGFEVEKDIILSEIEKYEKIRWC